MSTLKVLHLCSKQIPQPSPFFQEDSSPEKSSLSQPTSFRKRFILLFHQSPKEKCPILVSGFSVLEYSSSESTSSSLSPPSFMYFDKLDSTGLSSSSLPKHSIRFFVQSFLQSIPHFMSPPIHFHLYAKAAPEYLFSRSETNVHKSLLQNRSFLQWWMDSLSCLNTSMTSCSSPLSFYFYSPGNPISSPINLPSYWNYQLPWSLKDSPQQVPVFPDDELGRLITTQKEVTSLKDLVSLWDTLAAPWTAHITIQFHPSSSDSSLFTNSAKFPEAIEVEPTMLDDFITFVTKTLDFGSKQGISSCSSLLQYIKKISWKLHDFDDSKLREIYLSQKSTNLASPPKTTANDVSCFVKKKSSSVVTPKEPIFNVLPIKRTQNEAEALTSETSSKKTASKTRALSQKT